MDMYFLILRNEYVQLFYFLSYLHGPSLGNPGLQNTKKANQESQSLQ